MADVYQIQLRSGTTAQNDAFTGAAGELTYDSTAKQVRLHDGSTAGGFTLLSSGSSITNVDINSGAIDGTTIGANSPAAGTFTSMNATGGGSLTGTWSDLGTVTTVDINGGTIDGVTIGGVTPGAGTFTSMNATGGGSLTGTWSDLGTVTTVDINGGTVDGVVIGGATPAAGNFTTLGSSNSTRIIASAATVGASESLSVTDSGNAISIGADATDNTPLGLWQKGTNASIRNYIQLYGRSGASVSAALRLATDDALDILASGDLTVTANGLERMRIDSSGNIGVGTSSPNAKAEFITDGAPAVSGNMNTGIVVAAAAGSYALNIGADGTGTRTWINSGFINNSGVAAALDIEVGTTTAMRIDTSGNTSFEGAIHTPGGEKGNAIGSTGGGTQDIDLDNGRVQTLTVDTSTNTFTFSNPATYDRLTLIITNGGSQTVNWPASVDWAEGTEPTLTTAGVDIITFITTDGGTTWYGFASGLDMQ